MHFHEHDDHFHAHEHYHGGDGNIIVSTIGLVIHSIADGAALGASLYCKNYIGQYYCIVSSKSEGENSGLGLLIFIAILLHKAPAAIGFGTFLQHEGLNQNQLIKHLGVRNLYFIFTIVFHTCCPYFLYHNLFPAFILGNEPGHTWREVINVWCWYPSAIFSWLFSLCSNNSYSARSLLQY